MQVNPEALVSKDSFDSLNPIAISKGLQRRLASSIIYNALHAITPSAANCRIADIPAFTYVRHLEQKLESVRGVPVLDRRIPSGVRQCSDSGIKLVEY